MRRSDFLALTALKVDFFNALVRQRVIPVDSKSAAKRGWGDYSADLALLTNISLSLARGGASQESAAGLVRSCSEEILDAVRASGPDGEDYWFGYVVSTTEEYDEEHQTPVSATIRVPVEGTRAQIDQQILDWRASKQVEPISAVTLISVTEQFKLMMARAEKAGLEITLAPSAKGREASDASD